MKLKPFHHSPYWSEHTFHLLVFLKELNVGYAHVDSETALKYALEVYGR